MHAELGAFEEEVRVDLGEDVGVDAGGFGQCGGLAAVDKSPVCATVSVQVAEEDYSFILVELLDQTLRVVNRWVKRLLLHVALPWTVCAIVC